MIELDFLIIRKGKDGNIGKDDIRIESIYEDEDTEDVIENIRDDEDFICMVPVEFIEEEMFLKESSDDYYNEIRSD